MKLTRRSALSETVPLRGELLAVWLPAVYPVWLATALTATIIGLLWRLTSAAPEPRAAIDMLGLAAWSLPLSLYGAWRRLLRREAAIAGSPGLAWRMVYIVLLGLGTAYLIVSALGGVAAGFNTSTFFTARPIDVEAQDWSVPKLLWWALLSAGVPWLLLSLAALTLCHRWLQRWAVFGWLGLGLALNSSALTSGQLSLPFSPGEIASRLVSNLSNSEPMLQSHLLGPIHVSLGALWVAAIGLLAASALVRIASPLTASALAHAVAAAFLAGAIRAVALAHRWLSTPTVLAPDTLASLTTTVVVTLLLSWWLVGTLQPRSVLYELRYSWWRLVLLVIFLLPVTVPLILADAASHIGSLRAATLGMLTALALLGVAGLVWRLCWPGLTEFHNRGAVLWLGSTLTLALSWRTPENQPALAAALEALAAGVATPGQQQPALTIIAACLVAAAAGIFLPRHLGLRARRAPSRSA